MKRRHFIGTLASGGFGAALGADATPQATPAVKPPLVRTPLVLMAPRSDGIEAVWAVSRRSRGRVEWAADEASQMAGADAFGFVPQGESIVRVRLSGLKPGTEYPHPVAHDRDGRSGDGCQPMENVPHARPHGGGNALRHVERHARPRREHPCAA